MVSAFVIFCGSFLCPFLLFLLIFQCSFHCSILACIWRCAINPDFPPDYFDIELLDISIRVVGFKHFTRSEVCVGEHFEWAKVFEVNVSGSFVFPQSSPFKEWLFSFYRFRLLNAPMPMKCSLNSNQPSARNIKFNNSMHTLCYIHFFWKHFEWNDGICFDIRSFQHSS